MKKAILFSALALSMTACVENPTRHDNHHYRTWCESHPLECRDSHRDGNFRDRDDNPPGRIGGRGTNWENPPGPRGGYGISPDRRRTTR